MTQMRTGLTGESIARTCGQMPDWKFAAIERSGATLTDLEVALAWANGEDDVMGDARIPLVGKAQQVYTILLSGEEGD